MISADFSRLRSLVIDDSAHMRRIVRTLLYSFGTRDVLEAGDGASGLEAFIHLSADIVITDWAMPIIDGLELTQIIRQPGTVGNPYVPIIMVTADAERRHVISARDAGANEFLANTRMPVRFLAAGRHAAAAPGEFTSGSTDPEP
jgi:CheY-like chemotaxis protein